MPNWCYSGITIKGSKQDIDHLRGAMENKDSEWLDHEGRPMEWDMTNLVPMPAALRDTDSPSPNTPEPHPNWDVMLANGEMTQEWYDHLCQNQRNRYEAGVRAKAETGYSDWYAWALDNWGTKWSPCITEFQVSDTQIWMTTETAWGPADKLLKKITELYPSLSIAIGYHEEGCGYVGGATYINGETIYDECIDFEASQLPEPYRTQLINHDKAEPESEDGVGWADSDEWFEWHEKRLGIYHELSEHIANKAHRILNERLANA